MCSSPSWSCGASGPCEHKCLLLSLKTKDLKSFNIFPFSDCLSTKCSINLSGKICLSMIKVAERCRAHYTVAFSHIASHDLVSRFFSWTAYVAVCLTNNVLKAFHCSLLLKAFKDIYESSIPAQQGHLFFFAECKMLTLQRRNQSTINLCA